MTDIGADPKPAPTRRRKASEAGAEANELGLHRVDACHHTRRRPQQSQSVSSVFMKDTLGSICSDGLSAFPLSRDVCRINASRMPNSVVTSRNS